MNIHIHGNIVVHLTPSIASSTELVGGEISNTVTPNPPARIRPTAVAKILADGTRLPASDTRTDHVAVEFDDGMQVTSATLKQGSEAFRTQREADQFARDLDLLGKRAWLLGDVYDYQRYVIDYSRNNPCVDPNLFPNIDTRDRYWTRTGCDWSRDAPGVATPAWYVSLDYGLVGYSLRSYSGFALAFRRPGVE